MRPECITEVSKALGRKVSSTEAQGIEDRITAAMRGLARQDPTRWQGLSSAERLREGAQSAAKELVAQAAKKKQRAELTIAAHQRIENYVSDQLKSGRDTSAVKALSRMLAPLYDGKNRVTSIESATEGVRAYYSGRIAEALETAGSRIIGLARDREAERMLVRAMWRDPSVAPEFAKAAGDVHKVFDELKDRFNRNGGDIGSLDNYDMPHAWSKDKITSAGAKAFADAMLPLMDRSQYRHDNGRAYTDAEMHEFLRQAGLTVITDGATKVIGKDPRPSSPGGRIKANRNSQERQIHLSGADAYLEAMRRFSDSSVQEAILGHVNRMSRDIATVETAGPNADHTISHFLNRFVAEDVLRDAEAGKGGGSSHRTYGKFVAELYNYVSGNQAQAPSSKFLNGLRHYKNIKTAAALGGTTLSAIADNGTLYLTAKANGIPAAKIFLQQAMVFNPANLEEKAVARRSGLMAAELADGLNRWGGDVSGSSWSSKTARTVLKVSGLNAITAANKRVFSTAMLDQIGDLSRRYAKMSDLRPEDHRFLTGSGLTDADWDIIRAAEPTPRPHAETYVGGDEVAAVPNEAVRSAIAGDITAMRADPEAAIRKQQGILARTKDPAKRDALQAAIDRQSSALDTREAEMITQARENAITRLMGFTVEEQNTAVLEPGARERALINLAARPDTLFGQLGRMFFMFKTFSIAMWNKHIMRGWQAYGGLGKAAYLTSLLGYTTVFGALAIQLKDMINGKDPGPVVGDHSLGFWTRAMTTGGGLGIYGDLIFNNATTPGQGAISTLGGPFLSEINNLDDITRVNAIDAGQGNWDQIGARTTRIAKGLIPGSNLWYTKAATDHLIFNQLQEFFAPGSLARARRKAHSQHGTSYWYAPDEGLPGRLPDPSAAAGGR